jgi:hypothetical protein
MSNLVPSGGFKDRAIGVRRRPRWLVLAAPLVAALLAGCTDGATSDDRMGRFLVSPGKYDLYPCPQMGDRGVELAIRQNELEVLIAKAGPGAGGSFASAVAYRPEYLQVRAELAELRKAAAAKNCDLAKAMAATRAGDAARERDADAARKAIKRRANDKSLR